MNIAILILCVVNTLLLIGVAFYIYLSTRLIEDTLKAVYKLIFEVESFLYDKGSEG